MNRKNFLCMNRYVLIVLAAAAISMAGCGGCTHQTPAGDGADSAEVFQNPEQTIFGICGEGSAMNTLQVMTDGGDTLTLSLDEANERGRVFGGYDCGDRMAVVLGDDSTAARLVINVTTLLGNWLMAAPSGGGSSVGISLKDGGKAESIGRNAMACKAWRIAGGRLEISAAAEGGSGGDDIYVYDIVKLDADSLAFAGGGDVFRYARQDAGGL